MQDSSGNAAGGSSSHPFQSKPASEIRMEKIKSMAARYEQLKAQEKVQLLKFLKADIADERNLLARSLEELDSVLGEGLEGESPRRQASETRSARAEVRGGETRGGMTYAEAVVEALKGGQVMDKQDLFRAANALAGGTLKANTFNAALPGLKKAGKIKSPGRGEFQIA